MSKSGYILLIFMLLVSIFNECLTFACLCACEYRVVVVVFELFK